MTDLRKDTTDLCKDGCGYICLEEEGGGMREGRGGGPFDEAPCGLVCLSM